MLLFLVLLATKPSLLPLNWTCTFENVCRENEPGVDEERQGSRVVFVLETQRDHDDGGGGGVSPCHWQPRWCRRRCTVVCSSK